MSYHSPSRLSPSSSRDSLRALELTEGIPGSPTSSVRTGLTTGTLAQRTPTSSLFEFQAGLLPLGLSTSEARDVEAEVGTEKTVGLVNGIALVVGLQIGSGIFSSPGVVLADSGSVGASLIVWLVSGLLAWTGASSFAELGAAIPLNGGAQAYLAYAYHPIVSYLYAWTAIAVLKPGSNAIIALIFGEYVNRLFYDAAPDDIPQWAIKLSGTASILLVALICVATPKFATRVAVLFTSVKMAALLAVAIMGLIQLARGNISTSFTNPIFEGTSPNPSSYALALFSGLWAYDGWDQVNFVAGEMKNVGKTMPRVIHSSMTLVTLLFLLANVSYFLVLDKSTVESSNTVALDFGRALFGNLGGVLFSVMVAISCFGALNGSFFTSARLIFSAGKEGFLPSWFAQLHRTRKTPVNAMILQTVLTLLFVIVGGGFRSLVNFYSVASWGFYFLTVLGLVVLRVREPHLERPYKTLIITPLIFCAVALFLLSMPILAAPLEALAALGFILAGIPIYLITQGKRPSGSILDQIRSWFSGRGQSQRGGGWTRVATEADDAEEVEMRTSLQR